MPRGPGVGLASPLGRAWPERGLGRPARGWDGVGDGWGGPCEGMRRHTRGLGGVGDGWAARREVRYVFPQILRKNVPVPKYARADEAGVTAGAGGVARLGVARWLGSARGAR